MYRVTYKEPGATVLQEKYFNNRRVADVFVLELGDRFISLEEVVDGPDEI